ncbi:MAG: hypothetical protein NTW10_06350 [Bacteroidetes bacterium]|nr:hypothetical protein [Bacteroidota bacterium]
MKTKCVLFLLFILPFSSFSQDTIKNPGRKCRFSFEAGAAYKGFVKPKYISPDSYSPGDTYRDHQFDRFTRIPTFTINAGISMSVRLSKHWTFTTGLIYYLRKDVYRMDIDSVINYYKPMSFPYITGVYKYNYFYNNIEVPFMFGYRFKKLTFSFGFNTSLLSYRKTIYSYVIKAGSYPVSYETTRKTVGGFENAITIYPSIRIGYEEKISGHPVIFYLGIGISEFRWTDFYIHFQTYPFRIEIPSPETQPCFYLQAGVQIPLKF